MYQSARGNALDVMCDVRDQLSALSLIFEERDNLTLNGTQLAGIVSICGNAVHDLDEVAPHLTAETRVTDRTPQRPAFADVGHPFGIEQDVRLVLLLTGMADQLFMTKMTNKGGDADLCESVWNLIEQIKTAAERIEATIGLSDEEATADQNDILSAWSTQRRNGRGPVHATKPDTPAPTVAEATRPCGPAAAPSLDLTEPATSGGAAAPDEARRDRA